MTRLADRLCLALFVCGAFPLLSLAGLLKILWKLVRWLLSKLK